MMTFLRLIDWGDDKNDTLELQIMLADQVLEYNRTFKDMSTFFQFMM
jgi:hypothetical protein